MKLSKRSTSTERIALGILFAVLILSTIWIGRLENKLHPSFQQVATMFEKWIPVTFSENLEGALKEAQKNPLIFNYSSDSCLSGGFKVEDDNVFMKLWFIGEDAVQVSSVGLSKSTSDGENTFHYNTPLTKRGKYAVSIDYRDTVIFFSFELK